MKKGVNNMNTCRSPLEIVESQIRLIEEELDGVVKAMVRTNRLYKKELDENLRKVLSDKYRHLESCQDRLRREYKDWVSQISDAKQYD